MIHSYLTKKDIKNKLIQLTDHSNNEVRMYAIEQLGFFSGDEVGEVIVPKLTDPNLLVRVTAAEVLGLIEYKEAIPYLCRSLDDKHELVRAYTAEVLGKLGDKGIISLLKEKLNRERRNRARLGFYLGLYHLDEIEYLNDIIKMLNCKSYRVRCAVANSLVEIADMNNFTKIKECLRKALSKEKTTAVQSSLYGALTELDEIFVEKNID
ncbi:hypothetical protein B6A27_07290 [Anoxybacillus sp. UARK-01]|nr:hypothetical protein B6A27_07290 [Anoxybacillus sp. UARK-01]